jgi:hypothetical protein
MKEIKKSLKVGREALQVLSEITGRRAVELFNDCYKDHKTRRLKICFSGETPWVSTEQYKAWNEEFMKRARGGEYFLEFKPVNKLKSMGGKEEMEKTRDYFVKGGHGTEQEYMEHFNNEHAYFVVMIKGQNVLEG